MKILIVSATEKEINLFLEKTGLVKKTGSGYFSGRKGSLDLNFLITGVGLPATIYQLTKITASQHFDLIINCGIAGTFKEVYPIGMVTYVESEIFGDLGIDNKGEFLTLFETGLCDKNSPPFASGKLMNRFDDQKYNSLKNLKKVTAVTVNKASGEENEIVKKWMKFQADIESMEGAGVFYVCLNQNIPFIELRAISNYVEPRNVKKWNIPLALINLNNQLEQLLTEMDTRS